MSKTEDFYCDFLLKNIDAYKNCKHLIYIGAIIYKQRIEKGFADFKFLHSNLGLAKNDSLLILFNYNLL